MNELIRGAGGGKGGGGTARAAVEAPDSLRSKQFARVLDLISEGEIGGLVDGLKSVYLNDTPLQNADDSFNFQDVVLAYRYGTQAQEYLPGFPAAESEVVVGAEVTFATSVVRTITSANVDAARVTLSFPQLTHQNTTNGDLNGTSVEIAIDVQTAGGGYVEQLTDTITGKTTTQYQRSYHVTLTGAGPWDIRVRRITADSVSAALVNKTWWSSYTEIIDQKLRYPNCALVGISIDAAQFDQIPTRGYDVKLLQVLVPSNYFPLTRTYTRDKTTGNDTGTPQTWDGSFYVAWTDNPAWCWYDLVTNERYGLGEYVDTALVDKWALYTIGKYCDEMVPDGFGGTEPRFTCNLYMQTREEAYRVINAMASIFRGMAFWAGGGMTATHDAPADPIALFTAANVIGGEFQYTGSSKKARHTVVLVTWNDPSRAYRQEIEYVEDQAGIARYGVVQTEVVAVGCTSRGQAHRIGRWLLYTERLETEVVVFRTGLEGAHLFPGAVITTQDPARSGKRHGGRVISATTTAITVDAGVVIESAKTYTLSVVLPDGSIENRVLNNAPVTRTNLYANSVTPILNAASWVASVDGTLTLLGATAKAVVPNTTSSNHSISSSSLLDLSGLSVGQTKQVVWSIKTRAYAGGYKPYLVVRASDGVSLNNYLLRLIDPADGSIDASTTGTGWSNATCTVTLTDGWYEVSLAGTYTKQAGETFIQANVQIWNASNQQTYAGDGTSGVYLDAPQFEEGAAPSAYIPTTGAIGIAYDPVANLTFATPLTAAPQAMGMWVVSVSDLSTETWRVVGLTETSTSELEVSAVEHHPEKFALVEQDVAFEPAQTVAIDTASYPPSGLTAATYLSASGGLDVVVSWSAAEGTKATTIMWRKDSDNFVSEVVYAQTYTIRNASIGTYTILVSTTNSLGALSVASELVYNVVSAAVLPDVTGLALKQPFVDQFASFTWDALPTADAYRVQVEVSSVVKRDVLVTDNWFNYNYADSTADGAGTPFRAFDLKVKAVYGTLESGNWATLTATNTAPAAPAATVTAITGGVQVSAPLPADSDYAGMQVWASTTTGFTPGAGNLVYDGVNNSANILNLFGGTPIAAGVPLYVRVAFYDVFGKTGLNLTGQYSATPLSNTADLPVVASLPGSGTEGQVVYLTTDDKLYRYDGTNWVTWVDGSDILASSVTAAKISVSSLSALSANMGTLTSGNITVDGSGFIRGGSTGYLTGSGFWMGYHTAAYKFHIGDPAARYMAWTGTDLVIQGTQFSLVGGVATFSGALSAATGSFGALTVASGGNIKMGQTAFNTGTGFWLGDNGGVAKFSIGNPSGAHMKWDGSRLIIIADQVGKDYESGSSHYNSATNGYTVTTSGFTLETYIVAETGTVTVFANVSYDTGFSSNNSAVSIRRNGAVQGDTHTLTTTMPNRYQLVRTFQVVAGDTVTLYAQSASGTTAIEVAGFWVSHPHSSEVAFSDLLTSATYSTSYVVKRRIRIDRGGIVTVIGRITQNYLQADPGTICYGRVYLNGAAYGTEFQTGSTTGFWFATDVSCSAGDDLEVWVRTNSGGGLGNITCNTMSLWVKNPVDGIYVEL